jgi:hypothetical protein
MPEFLGCGRWVNTTPIRFMRFAFGGEDTDLTGPPLRGGRRLALEKREWVVSRRELRELADGSLYRHVTGAAS